MPVDAKPLFRPDVLRAHLSAFTLPPHVADLRPKLAQWAGLIATGKAATFKEQELLPDFLTDYFGRLLGYLGPAEGGERYTISRERHVEVDGKIADAVLGEFSTAGDTPSRFVVALEGKGPKDPLDRPFAGRRMSAVDQGYRYAINLPCDWIIVTSIRETRLYHKGSDQHTYESFETESLADSEAALLRFVFLLGAERVVPAAEKSHLYALLEESEQVGRRLTREFYLRYADMRQDAFESLSRDNAAVPRADVLGSTQKLLDRVLFTAFCEDRGLLPPESIHRAYEHRDPYRPRPIWENFKGLFEAINRGNAALGIHAYNGGLFAVDGVLDSLAVSDEVCGFLRDLGSYDYRPAHLAAIEEPAAGGGLIDVDILGHIFEQSITDLERIKDELEGKGPKLGLEKHKTRRKKEGAFYTPAFITRYIIEQALGGVLAERFEGLRLRMAGGEPGGGGGGEEGRRGRGDSGRGALGDPRVYDLAKLKKAERAALVRFWEAWQDELATVRLLDPACGSGAFLIEAFDQLHSAYQASNDRLQELRGHRTLFDLDKRILENNLYGIDLNDEAIEICRLSLWIKTAERGKALTSLDHPIRVGNSVVSDPAVHPRALDWEAAFPEIFSRGAGGFDVVVGNPPYVRQELLSQIKPYLQTEFKAYHGMADLYVYFYERGLSLLRPGGRLSFVVTNKWMKSGYGEPLRRLFGETAWIESVVDFGHAKQIFEDADVFPSIIVARRPTTAPRPKTARLCSIPRDQLRIDDLSRQIEEQGTELPLAQLGEGAWQLEPGGVTELLDKMRRVGVPLVEFAGAEPYRGILTGLNEAFLLDSDTRNELVRADPGCAKLIRQNLRGQDFSRWSLDWAGYWLICIPSSENQHWPWTDAGDESEATFARTFPAREALIKRQDQGRFWWELRSCAYWPAFDGPKIMYPEITWRSSWGVDRSGTVCNNTAYFLAADDHWILAVANSPVTWWFAWRTAVHGKDEALRFIKDFVQGLPIPRPTDNTRASAEGTVARLIEIERLQCATRAGLLDWLRVEHEIEKPTLKLQSPIDLDSDAFAAEVKKVRGKKNPLSAAALKNLREEHARTIEPARALAAEAVTLERRISDLVNQAYGLKPEEIDLMWATAPPRMPVGRR